MKNRLNRYFKTLPIMPKIKINALNWQEKRQNFIIITNDKQKRIKK